MRSAPRDILLVEDNSARAQRRRLVGVTSANGSSKVTVRLHRISSSKVQVVAELAYRAGALKHRGRDGGKATVALELIDRILPSPDRTVVVAGPTYGCNPWFLSGLADRRLSYVVELRPSSQVRRAKSTGNQRAAVSSFVETCLTWTGIELLVPNGTAPIEYHAASLGDVELPNGTAGRLFAAQTGGIPGVHRGTILGLASDRHSNLAELLRVIGWARWIRPATRNEERRSRATAETTADCKRGDDPHVNGTPLTIRANITLAQRQDKRAATQQRELPLPHPPLRGALASLSSVLNVVELFAGAGGMGLGFLLAGAEQRRYRLLFSGEVNPIYVETLKSNHDVLSAQRRSPRSDHVPEHVEPTDLRTSDALSLVRRSARPWGPVHILIGGPPCQGFSNANRNSWRSANPHNRLIDVFLEYVESLRPAVFLLENVQGIIWTAKNGGSARSLSVVEHLARRMVTLGYEVFPKLLDAVWYGVPQYRSRLFLLGLRRDLGYRREDFGTWGPFPLATHGPSCSQPYVSVRDAIGDLPHIGNGEDAAEQPYCEPSPNELNTNPFLKLMRTGAELRLIRDHVTSRHAEYVIERYRRIPQGGNWQDIADSLTNYVDVQRTHSNIYRRLTFSEPSITIGHYRKSMLVHPSQTRGLSLREASRLQSFPDWFRFSGGANFGKTGIVHKQQQLANAVCPLLSKALAEFLLEL